MTVLQVALGGAIGALMRYVIGLSVAFPYGTLAVNVVGSLAMGVLFVVLSKGLAGWQPLLMTGMLGGFTTFSAFSLDTLRLVEAGRLSEAALYVLASVALSLLAVFVGVMIARGVFA